MPIPQKKFLNFFILFCILGGMQSYAQTNPCLALSSYKIVVLGSSTAAGAGTSSADSAWVNRYRTFLQSINPDNEVVNLAVGGYNTYRIMPTGFNPPPGRPNPDPLKNITAAIAENPDGIIVNMPSNDVAAGYSYAEQMFNLDSIVQIAMANNIQIWICTTQPRDFSNSTSLQLQSDLKDSITVLFSPFTIDFWSTIANVNHTINTLYNSGDGVHLNDAGHAILMQRVVDVDILSHLYSAPTQVDYDIKSINYQSNSECGDSNTVVEVILANIGVQDSVNSMLQFIIENETTGLISYDSISFTPTNSCTTDTLMIFVNSYQKGFYTIGAYTESANDINFQNDSIVLHFNTIGHPQKFNLFDTLCAPGTGDLLSINQSNDTTFWYENFNDSIPIYAGALFQSPSIDSTTTWYAETMRGDLFYTSALETTTSSNIYWNGAMMDIIPSEDLILDSIGLKVNTTGQQSVDIYFKTGSYIGFENNANAWTLLTTSTSFVDDSLGFTYYTLPSFTLTSGDTLGLYMQMSNPQSKLSYQSVSNPITRSNSELTIITGSGVSYNFSGSYFPRDLNCDIHYHFGSRPHGACSTGKYPATIFISDFEINIGNDTIIDIGDSISIEVPLGLANWYWNNSSTDSTLILTGIDLGPGIHYIVLSGYDSLDCFKTDERIIGVADLVSVNESRILYGNLYPNPTKDWIYADREYHQIAIYSISGELVSQSSNLPFNISSLPSGIYYITVLNKNYETERFKIIKN